MSRTQRRAQAAALQRIHRSTRREDRRRPFRTAPPPTRGGGWFGEVRWVWSNGFYVVLGRPVTTEWGTVLHLACRNAGGTDIPWSDLQWIKDQLAGSNRVAFQAYPPKDELVDAAPMYHLWVLPPGSRLPTGISL